MRRAHDAHALVAQRPHLDAAPASRVGDDAEVAGAGAHRAIDLFRPLVVDADLDAGVTGLEALLERLQQVDAGGVDRGDHHLAHQRRGRGLTVHRRDAALEVVVAIDQLAALAREHLAGGGELGRTHRAVEQLDAQLLLELLDALAHRRLGDAVELGGFGEAAQCRDVAEEAKAVHDGRVSVALKILMSTCQ